MGILSEECYRAASYSRLSKDDGDKGESDSITNQKELIKNFQKSHSNINIVEEYSDDGYSGINFERPDFKRMMHDINLKKINCIIVKDLSRFGRNYIETGKYMEQILPFLGVRFISINDNYDSASKREQSDQIILPFKNLVNDTYCRDISIKVRSNLNAKRRKGDYVGAFAPYGYIKSEKNKNQLVIDPQAAKVVKQIFQLKLEGKSNAGIIDILNQAGIPSPYEYKKHSLQGKNFKPSFFSKSNSAWSIATLLRIMENEVYLGHLEQGKSSRPNYKVKEQVAMDKREWIRVENTHEAIISQNDFELVHKLLLIDTRTTPGSNEVYLLSGMLYCANCKEPLIRRKVSSKNGKYVYYGCYTKERKMKCRGISIRESIVEAAVKTAIKRHIELFVEMDELLTHIDEIPLHQQEIVTINEQIKNTSEEALRYKCLKASLHGDYHEGLIEREEYIDLKNIYDGNEERLKKSIIQLSESKKLILEGKNNRQRCVRLFKEFKNIECLDRKTIVSLISKIYITSNKQINIQFMFQDEFDEMCLLLKRVKGGMKNGKSK